VTRNGVKMGDMTVKVTLTSSGGLQADTILNISQNGRKGKVAQGVSYDKSGRILKQTMSITSAQPKTAVQFTATYGAKNVSVKAEINGQNRSNTIAYPANVKLRDTSAFWFIRTKPKPGTTATYHRLDMQT